MTEIGRGLRTTGAVLLSLAWGLAELVALQRLRWQTWRHRHPTVAGPRWH